MKCPANDQAKGVLVLKTVLRGPFRAGMVWGSYRGLRPRLLTVAPAAPTMIFRREALQPQNSNLSLN